MEQSPCPPQSGKTGVKHLQSGDSVHPKSISGRHPQGLPCQTSQSRYQPNQHQPKHHPSTHH